MPVDQSTKPKGRQPQRFLRDIAYEKIKSMLFLNEDVETAYSERQIASELDLGLASVRSAVERLKLEGLIVVVPNAGIILPELSAKAIMDFYDVRRVIETHVVTSIAGQVSQHDIATVQSILDEQDECVRRGNFVDYHGLDMKFHLSMAHIYGNEEMIHMLERLRDKMHRLSTRLHRKFPGRLEANVQQHRDIFAAVCANDPELARRTLESHLEWGLSFVIDPRSQNRLPNPV